MFNYIYKICDIYACILGEFEWEIQGEATEVTTTLMLNDGSEEGSLEVLALPSVESINDNNDLSTTVNVGSLPALPPASGKL